MHNGSASPAATKLPNKIEASIGRPFQKAGRLSTRFTFQVPNEAQILFGVLFGRGLDGPL